MEDWCEGFDLLGMGESVGWDLLNFGVKDGVLIGVTKMGYFDTTAGILEGRFCCHFRYGWVSMGLGLQ